MSNKSDGVSSTQWYLPAMGELGFLMPRFNAINATITAMGGVAVVGNDRFCSSSECSASTIWFLNTGNGYIASGNKDYNRCVRPFGVL